MSGIWELPAQANQLNGANRWRASRNDAGHARARLAVDRGVLQSGPLETFLDDPARVCITGQSVS